MIGDYPIAPVSNDKVLSRKYVSPVMKLVINHLKSKKCKMLEF